MKLILILFAVAMADNVTENVPDKLAENVTEKENSISYRADQQDNRLQQVNDKFTAKFFAEAVKSCSSTGTMSSKVLSAYSVLFPLGQLALASTGAAREELMKALSLSDENELTKVFAEASNISRSIKGVDLKTVNRLYVSKENTLRTYYQKKSIELFNSDIESIDFKKNEEAATEINKFVSNSTKERIQNLVDPKSITSDTEVVLVNAIYFKGIWADSFSESKTKLRKFHKKTDEFVRIPFMNREGIYKYGESLELNAKLLELDYIGHETSLLVILPNTVDGLEGLQVKLQDPSVLAKVLNYVNMASQIVDVFLPKFEIETTIDLKKVLEKMGIKKVFTPYEAQLTNLVSSNRDLFISNAIQKAFIQVNENGTEATAVDEFGLHTRGSFLSVNTTKFIADHPFVFYVLAKRTELFSGQYVE